MQGHCKMTEIPKEDENEIQILYIQDLIIKKRDGKQLTQSETEFFIRRVTEGSIKPAQLGAMLMAFYIRQLSDLEVTHLTRAMASSGEVLEWPQEWRGSMVDKHSTGGVGDKTSLILAPALAACGWKVPMVSGRGLGYTGGTLDNLESIPGFTTSLTNEQMVEALKDVGFCIAGQTTNLVPADKIMYSTRDVTGTADSLSIIADMSALRIPDIISKKRDGGELTEEEIKFFVNNVVNKNFEGAQLGAMLMAIYLKQLTDAEIRWLTREMTHSGKVLTWPQEWKGRIVDKHSTGGAGDKISLLLTPALAACGMKVPMISGRGLAHTGGTLDKLESIPGFRVNLTPEEMNDILDTVGCFIAGQTEDIVPADKIMYENRDVTGTVSSPGLITGSIISKKAAESLDALVLDVKTGKAAVLKDETSARELATQMVRAGNGLGIKTAALLTNMDAPIGKMIGNSLEVVEAIAGLHGQGPKDLYELVERLGGHALFLSGQTKNEQAGCMRIKKVIQDGTAVAKFCAMLKAQGVKPDLADDLCKKGADVRGLLPKSKVKTKVLCEANGYIQDIDGLKCAVVSCNLGAGRTKPGEAINYGVGLELTRHIGDEAKEGEPWIIVHHEDQLSDDVRHTLNQAVVVESTRTEMKSRIIDVISG